MSARARRSVKAAKECVTRQLLLTLDVQMPHSWKHALLPVQSSFFKYLLWEYRTCANRAALEYNPHKFMRALRGLVNKHGTWPFEKKINRGFYFKTRTVNLGVIGIYWHFCF